MNREELIEALLNALIGSVPVIFFIGVTAFAVECIGSQSNDQATDSVEE
jgi:hypothetical protein